jgi:nitrite reductase/ring-hydroxylating ferredoxin subunit/ferredoxin-NADP reductase
VPYFFGSTHFSSWFVRSADCSLMSGGAVPPQRIRVGPRSQFAEGTRQLVKCGVRNIAVVCHKGQLYAIDNACYHHGGPLLRGDIEEMGGHPCIVCPWHSYKIALDTGEGLYMGIAVNPCGGPTQQMVKSKGCKQRVHHVSVDDAGDVYVTVDLSGSKWESDTYATMELANQERATVTPMAGDGPGPRVPGIHSSIVVGVRSGHVFQQMETGRGGTNPFNAGQKTRPPVSPVLLGGVANNTRGGCSSNTHITNLFVSCTSITDVCAGVKEFHFVHYSGPLLRHAELGEHVELELPLKESRVTADGGRASTLSSVASFASGNSGEMMRRRWTICDVNRKGALFTLMVKAVGTDPQTSGSAWLHQRSLHTPLRVCSVGGTFTFVDHHDTIRMLRGNTLWVTAGIGITSAYAAMNSSLDDTFFVEGSEPLHVVHLHANHTLETVPKLSEFVRWQHLFPSKRASLGGNNNSDASPTMGRFVKSYVMELFISSSGRSEEEERLARERRGSTPPPASTTPLTNRHRLRKEDVVRAVHTYFGPDLPLAYVCGPPSFVNDCTDALLSAGLPVTQILTDEA